MNFYKRGLSRDTITAAFELAVTEENNTHELQINTLKGNNSKWVQRNGSNYIY
jgi:hypothetical protein